MTVDQAGRARIVRNGILALIALVSIGLLARYQSVQNPRYESARAYVEVMEKAFRNLESGRTAPEDYSYPVHGFSGFRLGDPEVSGLIGTYDGRCYVIWQRPKVGAGAGVVEERLPCEADSRLEFSQSYETQVLVVPAGTTTAVAIGWDPLLPASGTPGWFILAISLLGWLALNSFVTITIIMYRRRRKT